MKIASKEEVLSSYLKKIGLSCIRKIEEKFDEQFVALKHLYDHIENKESFPLLVLLNASVSYQLNTFGENYWKEFSIYFSNSKNIKNEIEELKSFLLNCKGNRRFINAKLKRLEKFNSYLKEIKSNYSTFFKNPIRFWYLLGKILNQSLYAKTVVFSIKMFLYSLRIYFNTFRIFPMEIPIPLDSRIKNITKHLTNENAINFWFKISKKSGIPPLHIDSLIWTTYRKEIKNLKYICPKKYKTIMQMKSFLNNFKST